MYLNLAETPRDPGGFWSAQAYERLRRIKADIDPDDVIRSNHPVPPLRRQDLERPLAATGDYSCS